MMTSVLLRIVTLFFLLGAGAFAYKTKIIKDVTIDTLISIVINISLPFLYFHSLAGHANIEALKRLWFLPLGAAVIIALGFGLSLVVLPFLKLNKTKAKTFTFMNCFTNYGFLAIPVCYMLFGEEGLFNIVIFNIGFNVLFWTFGIWLLSSRERNPLRNLANPGTISLFLGLSFGLLSIRLPGFIMDAFKMLGSAAIPLAMLTVGSLLYKSMGSKAMRPVTLGVLVVSRLIAVPAIVFFLTGLTTLPLMIRAIFVLQAAMPSPAMTPLITRRFGGDPEFASTGVLFTTLISIVTVSFFMHLAGV